jgi:hypothetical protein
MAPIPSTFASSSRVVPWKIRSVTRAGNSLGCLGSRDGQAILICSGRTQIQTACPAPSTLAARVSAAKDSSVPSTRAVGAGLAPRKRPGRRLLAPM